MEGRSLVTVIRRPEPEKVVSLRLFAFRVVEAAAALLPATHARTIPVESINAPELKVAVIPAATARRDDLDRVPPKAIHAYGAAHQAAVLASVLTYYSTSRTGLPHVLTVKTGNLCLPSQSSSRRHVHLLLLAKRPLDVALSVLLSGGFALVVVLLALAEADQAFGVAVANVHF